VFAADAKTRGVPPALEKKGDTDMDTPFTADSIKAALRCAKPHCECQSPRGNVHCPAHPDASPSLTVTERDGRVLVHCHAGCSQRQVIDALKGLGLWPTRERSAARETRYEIRDRDGTLIAVHVRRDTPSGKRLWWERDGRKGLAGLRPTDLPLYGVHRLGDAREVIVVEGEKAADALLALGIAALGTVCGASTTPSKDVLRPLVERTVFLWPDNDEAGRAHMTRIAERLRALGCADVRVIEWREAPEKGDAADYVARGGTAEGVRQLMAEARPWSPERDQLEPTREKADGEDDRRSQAARLVALVESLDIELWHTPDDEPWVTIVVEGHREHWPLASPAFRSWLQRQFYLRTKKVVHHQALSDALSALAGRARFEGPEYPTFVRIAEHDGAIYLDLADEHWRAVRVTGDGWSVVTDPPVRFRRSRGMQPLPVPVRGGELERVWRFVRVAPDDQSLVLGWLLMTFRPRGPYPVLALVGEQGSGKSTAARVLRRLIDPNDADLRAEPREERDLWVAAVNGWVVALDNVSRLPNWLSDALCRIATGAGFAARTLYENSEETILSAQRPALVTAIADVITEPDLLDRALVITLPRLDDAEREPESAFWTAFERERPHLLGALLDQVAQALRRESLVRLPRHPRMADFARWAVAALDDETGAQFLARYDENRREAGGTALEASPLAAALIALVETVEHWRGTAQELLDELEARADEETRRRRERMRSWPKTARGLAGDLRRLAPVLRQRGIAVEFAREGHERRRLITLMRAEGGNQPSAPSASSAPGQNARHDADFSADGLRTVADGADDCGRSPSDNRPQENARHDTDFAGMRTVADGADGRFPTLRAHDDELLRVLRARGRAYVWELAHVCGVEDDEAVAIVERLLAAGLVRRVDEHARIPLSSWSRVAPERSAT
jgi:5S rRNA maturation endonuclease (ribonuclease M5)/energy-coupling factor transporter ATP-binding protein EcfA2